MAGIVLDLFFVLLAAKLGEEVFRRIGQPVIAGEILAGVVIGPSVFGLVDLSESIELFAELGVVFLLFWVGLENRIGKLNEVGPRALFVGAGGIAVPFVAGFGFGLLLGWGFTTCFFFGAALATTSTAITSATMLELGMIESKPARIVLGAAVVDDVLALILLAIAAGMAEGAVDVTSISVTVALALGFVAFFALGGTRLMAARPQILKDPEFAKSPLLPAVLLCLGLAALAAQVGLAAIIGAFLAGLMVAETKEHHPIEEEIAPLYAFFPPFFFAFIGMQLDLGELADGETLLILAGVTFIAVVAKLLGAYAGTRGLGRKESRIIAVGMVPRGEVGIVAAGIGLAANVISPQIFAVIVAMSLITTLIVPAVLPRLVRSHEEEEAPEAKGLTQ